MVTAAKKTPRSAKQRKSRPAPKGFRRPVQFAADEHIGINQLYGYLRDGKMPHIRLGRTILIPDDALDRLVTAGKP